MTGWKGFVERFKTWCTANAGPIKVKIVMDREQFRGLVEGQVLQYGAQEGWRRREVFIALQDIGFNVMLHEVKEAKYSQTHKQEGAAR